jgi:thymidylate synthase
LELRVRNVNEALVLGTNALLQSGLYRASRVGQTIEYPEPVITHYTHPEERVLFSPERDANPFLHFFESLWMLAGRNDVKFLELLNKRFKKYSDDGISMQGSYGFRWLKLWGNQLEEVAKLLQIEPDSRRAVITLWSPIDLMNNIDSSDIPCNTHLYFKVRDNRLNLTICNRSNDMLWGAYGANAVHFSMLQEYLAEVIGVDVGRMVQVSDSFHVYTTDDGGAVWARVKKMQSTHNAYQIEGIKTYPMLSNTDVKTWNSDLKKFFALYDSGEEILYTHFDSPFFSLVVAPMWEAYKTRDVKVANMIVAKDWKKACIEWLQRRQREFS